MGERENRGKVNQQDKCPEKPTEAVVIDSGARSGEPRPAGEEEQPWEDLEQMLLEGQLLQRPEKAHLAMIPKFLRLTRTRC